MGWGEGSSIAIGGCDSGVRLHRIYFLVWMSLQEHLNPPGGLGKMDPAPYISGGQPNIWSGLGMVSQFTFSIR
jgi:hypothetical protein